MAMFGRGRRRAAVAARRLVRDAVEASAAEQAVARLSDRQLELMAAAVGGADDACVLVEAADADVAALCCRAWRWRDLDAADQVRPAPHCPAARDPVYRCANPFHWSRLCPLESPPPPYCRFAKERLKPEDRAPSERKLFPGSLTTNGEGEGGAEWCKLAYWELSTRVGRLFPVESPTVNISTSPLGGAGLDLETLGASSPLANHDAVRRVRPKIDLGVTLSLEGTLVWTYNRSRGPVFVHSPALDEPDSRTPLVTRVPPGYCLCVFDRARPPSPPRDRGGPVDPLSVRVSFAKGWGPKYSRQDVTSCPCWFEVLLQPCR